MTLGQRIQELRKQAGLSQEGLGEALGVSRQAVSKWESDAGIPELDTLIAISRFFGITIGELLGVEEPRKSEEKTVNEEEMEGILRRYVEESRQYAPKPSRTRWEWFVGAACLLAVLIIVLFAQIGALKSSVSNLRGQLSTLDSRVSSSISGISGQIQSQIRDALEAEAELLSTFSWEVERFDLDSQTVTIRLNATLKDYSAGSRMQFLLDWVKTDETAGQTVSEFVEGPDFVAEVTLPMNYRAELTIRVEDADGNIREQLVDSFYSLHPDCFHLEAYNLMVPFRITVNRFGSSTLTAEGEQAFVDILSAYPDIYWPEEAVITAYVNREQVFTENMTITPSEDGSDLFCAALKEKYFDVTLREGDSFEVVLQVKDNLGRTEEFLEGGTVKDGRLEWMPSTAPAVRVD